MHDGNLQLTELKMREESEHQEAYLRAAWAELGLEAGPGMHLQEIPWPPQRLLSWYPPPEQQASRGGRQMCRLLG